MSAQSQLRLGALIITTLWWPMRHVRSGVLKDASVPTGYPSWPTSWLTVNTLNVLPTTELWCPRRPHASNQPTLEVCSGKGGNDTHADKCGTGTEHRAWTGVESLSHTSGRQQKGVEDWSQGQWYGTQYVTPGAHLNRNRWDDRLRATTNDKKSRPVGSTLPPTNCQKSQTISRRKSGVCKAIFLAGPKPEIWRFPNCNLIGKMVSQNFKPKIGRKFGTKSLFDTTLI